MTAAEIFDRAPAREVSTDFTPAAACRQMGIPIHQCDMNDALEQIGRFVEAGRANGRCHQVVTVNADFLVTARNNLDVYAILSGADLVLADGMPIVWASTSLGVRLPERVAGADLVPELAGVSALKNHRIMLFGGLADSAVRSAEILRMRNPGLVIEGMDCKVGPRGETSESDLERIREFAPDILCVALGHPKQERWIRANGTSLGVPVAIGVGGTLDFIADYRKRAPKWVGAIGLEWMYRLVHEPKRLAKRYLDDITVFVPSMARQITRMSFADQFRRAEARVEYRPFDFPAVTLSAGRIGRRTVEDLSSASADLRRDGTPASMVMPTYRQAQALRRERLDRDFLFVPEASAASDVFRRRKSQGETRA